MNITVAELKLKLDNQESICLVDVREAYEHEEFNIGGELLPLGNLPDELANRVWPKDIPLVIYCRSGNRSQMGQYLFNQAGYGQVYNLDGGMIAWQEMVESSVK